MFVAQSALNNSVYRPDVTADEQRGTVVVFFGETYRMGASGASLTGLQDRPYRLRWFNPRSGQFLATDRAVGLAGGRLVLPDKPDSCDWLLVVQVDAPV